jgi:predicted  nucleic acid-binding Zn-ribbon protein
MMATKYYCDGCDKELPPATIENISVTIKKGDDVSAAGGNYELCSGCAKHLCWDANPRNWVRCAPDAPPMKSVS